MKTDARVSTKRYVPRTCTKGNEVQIARKSESPLQFYQSATKRKDVRTILDKLAKA